jgi:hypothetical protein
MGPSDDHTGDARSSRWVVFDQGAQSQCARRPLVQVVLGKVQKMTNLQVANPVFGSEPPRIARREAPGSLLDTERPRLTRDVSWPQR